MAEREELGRDVMVVVGCGPVGARGAGFGAGSAGKGTGSEWGSGPVGGFGFETAPKRKTYHYLIYSVRFLFKQKPTKTCKN